MAAELERYVGLSDNVITNLNRELRRASDTGDKYAHFLIAPDAGWPTDKAVVRDVDTPC